MQMQAPDAFDLAGETEATRRIYGLDRAETEVFGRQCLLARRLVERGVRFVQLYHTTGGFQPWDQHSDLKGGHAKNALATDRPIAGLLQDLQGAWPARRDAGHLGRRVRPDPGRRGK